MLGKTMFASYITGQKLPTKDGYRLTLAIFWQTFYKFFHLENILRSLDGLIPVTVYDHPSHKVIFARLMMIVIGEKMQN